MSLYLVAHQDCAIMEYAPSFPKLCLHSLWRGLTCGQADLISLSDNHDSYCSFSSPFVLNSTALYVLIFEQEHYEIVEYTLDPNEFYEMIIKKGNGEFFAPHAPNILFKYGVFNFLIILSTILN